MVLSVSLYLQPFVILAIKMYTQNQTGPQLFGISQAMVLYWPFYTYFRLFDLPYHAVWHWVLAGLVVDFGYYWAHRAVHEINIGWAAHQ